MVFNKILIFVFQLSLFTSETGLIFAPKMRIRANTGSKTALELFKSKTLGTDIENIWKFWNRYWKHLINESS